jgi:hypothetical protein
MTIIQELYSWVLSGDGDCLQADTNLEKQAGYIIEVDVCTFCLVHGILLVALNLSCTTRKMKSIELYLLKPNSGGVLETCIFLVFMKDFTANIWILATYSLSSSVACTSSLLCF